MSEFLRKHNLSDPSCLLKWSWSTIRLFEGTSSSCFRVKQNKIDVNNYQDFHNTPQSVNDRISMQSGSWPGNGCEYCKKIEDAGGQSDRMYSNANGINIIPDELKTDPSAVVLTPKVVEVNFSNLCNLACIYCGPNYSTVWENEQRKYGDTDLRAKNFDYKIISSDDYDRNLQYQNLLKMHWQWMSKNAHGLQEYHILGGEPLIQPEFIQNIEFLENNPCPNTDIKVFTNLMIDEHKLRPLLDRIEVLINSKKVRSFGITCSLDCWGPQQEYIRYGLDLRRWESNFEILLNQYRNIKLHIHSTLISLSMDTLSEFLYKISEWKLIRKIDHSMSLANGVDHMHIGIFPEGFFDDKFEDAIRNCGSPHIKKKLLDFKKVANMRDSDTSLISELKDELNKFDSRRGTDHVSLWKWLES